MHGKPRGERGPRNLGGTVSKKGERLRSSNRSWSRKTSGDDGGGCGGRRGDEETGDDGAGDERPREEERKLVPYRR